MAKTQSDAAEDQPVNTLGYSLVVRHAFDQYRKGDMIRDQAAIERVLAGANHHNVHKVVA